MDELRTRDSENSLVNKHSYKKASTLDTFVERSAYVSTWKEIVNSPTREIHIILQFSPRLEPTD